jgi:hypothetical protein
MIPINDKFKTNTTTVTTPIVPKVFKANPNLMPPSLIEEKTSHVFWNVLSVLIPVIGLARLAAYGIGRLAARHLILPAMVIEPNSSNRLQGICDKHASTFTPHLYRAHTPDGADLNAVIFKHKDAIPHTPTTIYFQPNATLMTDGTWNWLLEQSSQKNSPRNFVIFDYRSCGHSQGYFDVSKDLLVDGATMVQLVQQELQTPDDRIDFYGYSIGGAVALKTKALHPKLTGKLTSDRSLSSFADVVMSWTQKLQVQWIIDWIVQKIASLAIWILKGQNLELDAAADLEKLQGESLFIYHKNDNVIPEDASIAKQVADKKNVLELTGYDSLKHHQNSLACYKEFSEITDFVLT